MSNREFETGGLLINDTATHNGRWRAVTCLTDAVFDAGTVSEDIAGAFSGQAIKAGTNIAGTFTALQLSAGSLVAFN